MKNNIKCSKKCEIKYRMKKEMINNKKFHIK